MCSTNPEAWNNARLPTLVRLVIAAIVILATLGLLPGRVLAHANLVRADLAPDSHALVRSGMYRFWFDEPINAALSRVSVRDSHGRQVNNGGAILDPSDSTELEVSLPTLTPGLYSVVWTSTSAQDGHVLHGYYLFWVGGPGASIPGTAPAAFALATTPELDVAAVAGAMTHWLVLVASVLWTGALSFEILVLRAYGAEEPAMIQGLSSRTSLRAGVVVLFGLLGTLLASVAELEAQAYQVSGWGGLTSPIALGSLLSSSYGTFWSVRMCLTFLTLLVLVGMVPERMLPTAPSLNAPAAARAVPAPITLAAPRRGRFSVALTGSLGLAYLLALALSGHAPSVRRLLVTSVLYDWLHLTATAVWIGGMATIALALVPALQQCAARADAEAADHRLVFLGMLDRFSPAAYLAVAVAGATGMFNAQVHLSSFGALMDTAYGRFLLIKLALIAVIVVLSASHAFYTRPRLARGTHGRRDPLPSLTLRLRFEPLLGALVLLCVALMGQVAPSATALGL